MQNGTNKADIAVRAYQIWESEGYPHGEHINHWLRAETELSLSAITKSITTDSTSLTPTVRRQRSKRR